MTATATEEVTEDYSSVLALEVDGIRSETGVVIERQGPYAMAFRTVGEVYRAPMASIREDPPCTQYEGDCDSLAHEGCITDPMTVYWDDVEQRGEDVAL